MMTLANYGLKSNKYKDPVSAKSLNKSLQIRNRAESSMRHCLKTFHRIPREKRNDILELLEEYYSRVPFDVVIWNTNQAKQCVLESILASDHGFNPYKARNAFQTIESMLINLEYLPWHKEFTRICIYSGGFRHNIASSLSGVEEVLRSAGFEQEATDRPMNLVIQPMRQAERSELIGRVIFDCMLAQVVISDIINIFESCCKSSKVNPNQVAIDEINCYQWIEHYFQDRSSQITEKACSNIQELLNNVTNHFNRHRSTSAKTHTTIDRSPDELLSSKLAETSQSRKELCDTQQRRHLNTDSFKLSDDLLKLPTYIQNDDRSLNNKRNIHCSSEPKFYSQSGNIKYEDRITRDKSEPYQLNHATRTHSRSKESLDIIDDEPDFSQRELPATNSRPGILKNDREPLIPRQDKRLPVYMTNEPQGKRSNQSYINNRQNHLSQDPGRPIDQFRQNSIDEKSRFKNFSSQQQLGSSKSVTSRYVTDIDDNRYEYRDTDRPLNSRLYWSCRSCTFINHVSNEICEMCRNRKLP